MHYQALATDFDGTLAQDGHVDAETLAAMTRLGESGRKLILVTGRELPELKKAFPEIAIFEVVVAENGGLLYWPRAHREDVLGEPPAEQLVAEMTRRGVTPFSVGRVILATWRPHETAVLEIIQQLGLGHQVIFNKGAVMVLPAGINKATGLTTALAQLEIAPEQTVGIGDAENDHAFLNICGVAVAVDNALAALKERCDMVTKGDHGRGVIELVEQLLEDDLQSLGPRRPREKITKRSISS